MTKAFWRLATLLLMTAGLVVWSFSQLYQGLQDKPQVLDVDTVLKFTPSVNEPLQLLPLTELALPANLQQALQQGRVLKVFDNHQRAYFYQWSSQQQQVLVFGPVTVDEPWRQFVVLLLYSTLAASLLLLIWPIFRDLARLKAAARQFLQQPKPISVPLASNSPVRAVGQVFEDVTHQLFALLQLHRELAQTFAHEVRTPLARLKFVHELTKHQLPNNLATRFLRDIEDIEKLAEQYLDFAKVDHQAQSLQLPYQALAPFWQTVQDNYALYPTDKTLTFIIPPEAQQATVRFDSQALLIACQNMLNNALNYANQQVWFVARLTPSQLIIEVTDDGCGFNTDQGELAQAFRRQPQAIAQNIAGFGLGLYITQKIAIWHNAQLQFCNVAAPDSGAKVSFSLPLVS